MKEARISLKQNSIHTATIGTTILSMLRLQLIHTDYNLRPPIGPFENAPAYTKQAIKNKDKTV